MFFRLCHKFLFLTASFLLGAAGIGDAIAGTCSTVHNMVGEGGMHYRPPLPLPTILNSVRSPTTFILCLLLRIVSLLISSSIGDFKIRSICGTAGSGRSPSPR